MYIYTKSLLLSQALDDHPHQKDPRNIGPPPHNPPVVCHTTIQYRLILTISCKDQASIYMCIHARSRPIFISSSSSLSLDDLFGLGFALRLIDCRVPLSQVLDDSPHQKDPRTEHEARPVIEGIKLAANFWIHQHDFKGPHARGCTVA